MTEQHRAKPETWAFIEECAPRYSFESCLLELHDRVEALEAGLTTVSLELRDRVEALEAALRPTIPECNEDYWRRDALESLLHAATSYKLNVYGVEELQIYEDRARKVLACWDKKPLESNDPAEPNSSLVGRRPWAAMSFRGSMLLPPPGCADPDLWIAERIYEMGFTAGKNAATGNTVPVTRDRAEDAPASSDSLVKEAVDAITDVSVAYGTADKFTCRTGIDAIAHWLDQQKLNIAATELRQEVE